ncbi:glycoside hydrolase family 30 protein [Spirochaeta thermophila]|uniref:Glucosylceramidase n=1 Tax=Winmispira thermophila (strain ATCC 49972 / DSM 6192 / RI 19.B1) TaxID=665571 RepID=E0RUA9_WINT6|nr:glycoside hydrolase family 30 beta sandwich domain-containing protein [Spirochaeta thermophila]ADN02330.1 glucosylceramidase precursor [Spirochaeta thermophila DSM 6192]
MDLNEAVLYESSYVTGTRLTPLRPEERSPASVSGSPYIEREVVVDPSREYQRILGFGGALTEASGYVLSLLPDKERERVIRMYFDRREGHGYTFARTHMNSCDFSFGNWALVEKEDPSLSSFDLGPSRRYQLPLVKDAWRVSGGLRLLVSPWSPPAWMKDNREMCHGGKLLPEYYPVWARYFVSFIRALQGEGLEVWGVTVQNEPEAVQTWESCIYTGEEEGRFVRDHLVPTFRGAGLEGKKVLIWDHNRDRLPERVEESFGLEGVREVVDGVAYHWYSGPQYDNVEETSSRIDGKLLVFTEGCIEGGARPGEWWVGERYGYEMIQDLLHGAKAWIDWNVVLDTEGGPNHAGNFCDAPVLVDIEGKEVFPQSSYYYIGHLSRWCRPGSRRIEVTVPEAGDEDSSAGGRFWEQRDLALGVRDPEGRIVLVLYNSRDVSIMYSVRRKGDRGEFRHVCPPHSIQTVILEA